MDRVLLTEYAESTATLRITCMPWRWRYALAPATATAPAGSRQHRVSLNTSLIAALTALETHSTRSERC